MHNYQRIWNYRLSGLLSAFFIALKISLRTLRDRVSTVLWRGNLGSLDSGARIQSGVTIRYPGNLFVGGGTTIAEGTEFTSERNDSNCRIGASVIIGKDTHLDFSGGLDIGNNVVVSQGVTLFTHSHGLFPKSKAYKTPLVIADDVWIGAHCTIVEGVSHIGCGAVIGVGAVVTKEVPAGAVVAGVPAKIIKMKS